MVKAATVFVSLFTANKKFPYMSVDMATGLVPPVVTAEPTVTRHPCHT